MNGATCQAISEPRPASAPTCQNRKESSVAVSLTTMARTIANSSADSAAPASARVTGVAPPRPAAPTA